jgi:hypothetical protein
MERARNAGPHVTLGRQQRRETGTQVNGTATTTVDNSAAGWQAFGQAIAARRYYNAQGREQKLAVYLADLSARKTGDDHSIRVPRRGSAWLNVPTSHGGLLPASQNRGHYAGAAAPVEYGHNPQRLFRRRVSNYVFPHQFEPQRARSEAGTSIALMGRRHQCANPVEDLCYHAVGSVWVVLGDVFADVIGCLTVLGGRGASSSSVLRRVVGFARPVTRSTP